MTTPSIRLAFGATFWRIFAVVAIFMEVSKWHRLERLQMMHGKGFRIAALIYFSPKILCRAFLIAAIVTVVVDLYVRLIMRPLLARWYSPRRRDDGMGTPLEFRLAASETVLDEIPARIVAARSTSPGVLVRTNRRLWFSPFAWDEEPWSLAASDLEAVATLSAPARLGSLIQGLPQRLCVRDRAGLETQFVVAEPRAVLRWYNPDLGDEPDDYQPSPSELF